MIIKADEEGIKAVRQLCDIALKTSGINNLDGVLMILQNLSLIEEEIKLDEVKEA